MLACEWQTDQWQFGHSKSVVVEHHFVARYKFHPTIQHIYKLCTHNGLKIRTDKKNRTQVNTRKQPRVRSVSWLYGRQSTALKHHCHKIIISWQNLSRVTVMQSSLQSRCRLHMTTSEPHRTRSTAILYTSGLMRRLRRRRLLRWRWIKEWICCNGSPDRRISDESNLTMTYNRTD